jgi:2'-5' RNA ligase
VRLFIALVPDEEGRDALAEAGRALRHIYPGWRWLSPEGLHITLAFLGERGAEALDAAAASLARIEGLKAFDASFDRILFLPSPKAPRVLALGAAGPGAEWIRRAWALTNKALAEECSARGLAALNPGFVEQKERFLPHCSLARGGRGSIVLPKGLGSPRFAPPLEARARFASIVLYESFLEPGGARYVGRAARELD